MEKNEDKRICAPFIDTQSSRIHFFKFSQISQIPSDFFRFFQILSDSFRFLQILSDLSKSQKNTCRFSSRKEVLKNEKENKTKSASYISFSAKTFKNQNENLTYLIQNYIKNIELSQKKCSPALNLDRYTYLEYRLTISCIR